MPIILTPSTLTPTPSAGGYTLQHIRRFAAQEAGRFLLSTATGGSQSRLLDASWPVNSQVQGSALYKDYWLYRYQAAVAADALRLVKTYDGVSGALDPDLAWTNAPTGEPYELHGMFPPIGNDEKNWRTLINDGLKYCMIPVEFTFNATTDTNTRHSMATVAPWLTDPLWVRKVGVLADGIDREQFSPYAAGRRGRGVLDGLTVYLETGAFNTTDTVYVTALKPAHNHCCASGGTFGDQDGLTLETDLVPAGVEWAAFAALCEGWRRFGQVLDQSIKGRSVNSLGQAAALFDRWDPGWERRLQPELLPVRQWGPPR